MLITRKEEGRNRRLIVETERKVAGEGKKDRKFGEVTSPGSGWPSF